MHIYTHSRQVSQFAVSAVAQDVRDVYDADLKSRGSSSNKDAAQPTETAPADMPVPVQLDPGLCV